jgi:translation initiation factor 2 subunit 3
LLRRLLGVKSDSTKTDKVKKIIKLETLMINVGSTSTGGKVTAIKGVNI